MTIQVREETAVQKWEKMVDQIVHLDQELEGRPGVCLTKEQLKESVRSLVCQARNEGVREERQKAIENFKWIMDKRLPDVGGWVDRGPTPIHTDDIAYLVDVEYGVDLASLKSKGETDLKANHLLDEQGEGI